MELLEHSPNLNHKKEIEPHKKRSPIGSKNIIPIKQSNSLINLSYEKNGYKTSTIILRERWERDPIQPRPIKEKLYKMIRKKVNYLLKNFRHPFHLRITYLRDKIAFLLDLLLIQAWK